MKIAIIVFLWIAGILCLFTFAVVIYDLAISSRERKERAREAARKRAAEKRRQKAKEAEEAVWKSVREAEKQAWGQAQEAEEAATRAYSSIAVSAPNGFIKTVCVPSPDPDAPDHGIGKKRVK